MNNLLTTLSAVLLLFFLSTSSDFAQISAVQEKLRDAQIKLLKTRVSGLQGQIDSVRLKRNQEIEDARRRADEEEARLAALPDREKLAQDLNKQIQTLQQVVSSLRPRAIDEEAARIESRVQEINNEIATASGKRLLELRKELEKLLTEYDELQGEIRESLEESVRRNQALVLQNQLRALEEKVRLLPRAPAPEVTPAPDPNAAVKVQIGVLQEKIQSLQLKILREKARLIQGQIEQVEK